MRFLGTSTLLLCLLAGVFAPLQAGTGHMTVIAKDKLQVVQSTETPEAGSKGMAVLTVTLPGMDETEALLLVRRLEDERQPAVPGSKELRPVLLVPRPEDQMKLMRVKPHDKLQLKVDETGKQVVEILDITRFSGRLARSMALLAGFMVVSGLAALVTRGRPLRFLVGADNRYSNSQVQLVLWFTTIATVYLAAQILRLRWDWGLAGGVDIPNNLLVLSGLSVLSFGGAKVITGQKVDDAAQSQSAPVKVAAAHANLLTDLVQNDLGQSDFGDFQMILVTLAAIGIFGLSAFQFLGDLSLVNGVTLPDVDTTLLSAFGLGQGAYLLKKAALKAGKG